MVQIQLLLRSCIVTLGLLVILALAACGGPPPPERSLTVTAADGRFTPETLTARVGEQVFLTLNNETDNPVTLVIELPYGDRRVSVERRVDAVLAFPAREAGKFPFHCDIPGYEEMRGTLLIEP